MFQVKGGLWAFWLGCLATAAATVVTYPVQLIQVTVKTTLSCRVFVTSVAGRLENFTFIFDHVPAPGPGSARRAV